MIERRGLLDLAPKSAAGRDEPSLIAALIWMAPPTYAAAHCGAATDARSGPHAAADPGPLHALVYGEAAQPELGLALDDGHV